MLKNCPECGLQVSDKAYSCPHCGYPFNENIKPIRRSTKRRRLPNGFGQITELKGRYLKRPFRAMVTTGFTEQGRPIQKLLKPTSYFETYNDAYEALVKYNKNPYSYNSSMTLQELFDKWYPRYAKTVNIKSINYIQPAWNRLQPLWNTKLCDLRKFHIKMLFDTIDTTPANINLMKRLLDLMLDYAVEYEIVEKNVARNIDMSNTLSTKSSAYNITHKDFSIADIAMIWSKIDNDYAKMMLIQLYMGWRPAELLNLTKSNTNINEWYIIGGMKTKAGIDRKVPIHTAIRHLVKYFYDKQTNTEYLFNNYFLHSNKYKQVSYQAYCENFGKILASLNIDEDHHAHDARVTFVTLCKKFGVDEYAIKYLVGHTITDLTENTYTKRDFTWLQSEIEKIKIDV